MLYYRFLKFRPQCTAHLSSPASITGIVCILMLVEATVTRQKLLTCSCGPRLAVQTLWVRCITTSVDHCSCRTYRKFGRPHCLHCRIHRLVLLFSALLDALCFCVQAASYSDHKEVEQVVTKWLHCVALSMLAGDAAARNFQVPEDIKENMGMLRQSQEG